MYDFLIEFVLFGVRLTAKVWSASVDSAVSEFLENVPSADIETIENRRTGVKKIFSWK